MSPFYRDNACRAICPHGPAESMSIYLPRAVRPSFEAADQAVINSGTDQAAKIHCLVALRRSSRTSVRSVEKQSDVPATTWSWHLPSVHLTVCPTPSSIHSSTPWLRQVLAVMSWLRNRPSVCVYVRLSEPAKSPANRIACPESIKVVRGARTRTKRKW